MHAFQTHTLFVWLISLVSIFCMLLRPWRIAEAVWISAGAALLVVMRLVPFRDAAAAIGKGTDVYLFLIGMMLLAELARHEGVFDWLADVALRHADSSASRLFILIYLAGVAVTALLSNDATAVVLTPAVLAVVRRARVEPRPYLLACALIANAASFVLPISNPANLVVYGQHIPALGPWLRLFLMPSIAAILATYLCLRALSGNSLCAEIHRPTDQVQLNSQVRLALVGLLFAAVALLVASGFGINLGASTCGVAIAVVVLVSFRDKKIFLRVAKDVSWSILPLVAGLFILVEALNQAGLLQLIQNALQLLLHSSRLLSYLGASFGIAILANLMNNLPVGLASGAALAQTPAAQHLTPAILIGVDLGPNLSVTGSLATILWLIALRREQLEITPWQFLRVGIVAMPLALGVSILVLWALS
ncbi:MAG TPA: arsenic transporter [Silvibacterium sp.]|nr:arsenic transporter [Silvibacterium sp.]